MKSEKPTRAYNMTARARSAARTGQRILEATVGLWQERSLHEITLEAVAERAGVTVRTVLRKYGSRERLFEACVAQDAARIMTTRDQAPAGDIPGALRVLLEDYETYGDANIRTLAAEGELEVAHHILATGRQYHRQWCARVFAPFLPAPSAGAYESRLLAFMVATDVYMWKLLRRDHGRSRDETLHIMGQLLEGLIKPV